MDEHGLPVAGLAVGEETAQVLVVSGEWLAVRGEGVVDTTREGAIVLSLRRLAANTPFFFREQSHVERNHNTVYNYRVCRI